MYMGVPWSSNVGSVSRSISVIPFKGFGVYPCLSKVKPPTKMCCQKDKCSGGLNQRFRMYVTIIFYNTCYYIQVHFLLIKIFRYISYNQRQIVFQYTLPMYIYNIFYMSCIAGIQMQPRISSSPLMAGSPVRLAGLRSRAEFNGTLFGTSAAGLWELTFSWKWWIHVGLPQGYHRSQDYCYHTICRIAMVR